jgi:hypothetical protein
VVAVVGTVVTADGTSRHGSRFPADS